MTSCGRIVCVAGWGATGAAWNALAEALPEYVFEPHPWWELLDGSTALMTGAIPDAAPPRLLLGWSLGGLLLLRECLAQGRGYHAPLCLLAGTAMMCSEGEYPGADPRALRAMRMRIGRDPEGVLAGFATLCAEPDGPPGFADRFTEQARSCPPGVLEKGLECLAETDLRGSMSDLSVPLLWIHGEQDAVIPTVSAFHAAALSPRIRLEILPGRGHALPYTAAAEAAQLIRSFIDGIHRD